MNNPPSAVNPWKLQAAMPPDNSRSAGMMAAVGTSIGNKYREYKHDKKTGELRDDLISAMSPEQRSNMIETMTPEQKAEASNELAISQQRDAEVGQADAKAQKARQQQTENQYRHMVVKTPEYQRAFLNIAAHDPQAAAAVMDVFARQNKAEIEAVTRAAQDAQNMWHNMEVINKTQSPEEVRQHLIGQARQLKESGQDPNLVMAALDMDPDQRGAHFASKKALAGAVLQLPETKTVTLADGAELREEGTGRLLARNEKDVAPGGGLASAKTEINKDGSTIQALPDGSVQVRNRAGEIVSGQERLSVLEAAGEFEIGQQEEGARIAVDKANNLAKVTRAAKAVDLGVDAAKVQPQLLRSIELLEEIETGGVDKVRLRAKQIFGVEGADEAELAFNLGSAVISQYRETFGSQFTVRETDKLDALSAGLGKSPAGNKRIIKNVIKMNEEKIKQGRRGAAYTKDAFAIEQMDGYLNVDFTPSDDPSTMSDADLFK